MDDKNLWLTIFGAVFVKVVLSGRMTFFKTLATSSAGIFAALVFTDPLLNLLDWQPEAYRIAVAGMLALTGENLLRKFIDISNSENVSEIIKTWRLK